jgi:hypothetical protein
VPDPPRLKLSKQPDGPYSDNLQINLQAGNAKEVFAKVKSTYPNPAPYEFDGPVKIDDYKLRYFKGGENVTSELNEVDEWFEFRLPAESATKIRIRVSLPSDGDTGGICALLRARVDYDPQPLPHNSANLQVNENPPVCIF